MTDPLVDGATLTSEDLSGFARRSFLRAQGRSGGTTRRRPVIGICSSWSELNPCNGGLRQLADDVKRGVSAAGGQAYEFPTISLAEQFVFPTSMILRNLMAMDVEEMIRRSPIDAVVLLAGCDKTVPAQLMGAASAGRPAIMLTAGPRPTSRFRGRPLVTDDFWSLARDRQAGRVSDDEWTHLEGALCSGIGVCNVLGTATTMAMMAEALGAAPLGSALIGAGDARRSAMAEDVGARAVELARQELPLAAALTAEGFDNALRLLVATGGSTNAVIHLEAIAGRVGHSIGLDRLAEIGRTSPLLTSVRPVGQHLLEDLQDVGGATGVLANLRPLLHLDVSTAWGATLGDELPAGPPTSECLRPLTDPFAPAGGIRVVRGNLAPDGAIIKVAAARPSLWRHEGPALVYQGTRDAATRSTDPGLTCADDAVLVVRGAGPVGGPGMPELGQIPVPISLRQRGVTDMVCLTDARVSGTQKGATVLHAAPESCLGGVLGLVCDDDVIRLDADAGSVELAVTEEELQRRRETQPAATPPIPPRGYARLYAQHVLQAPEGCDFDFLRYAADGGPA